MDDPINSLDIDNKMLIFNCIETIKNIIEIPIIYVTHSWHETIYLADHIMYIKDGKIHKVGPANVVKNDIFDGATENFKKYLQIKYKLTLHRKHSQKNKILSNSSILNAKRY